MQNAALTALRLHIIVPLILLMSPKKSHISHVSAVDVIIHLCSWLKRRKSSEHYNEHPLKGILAQCLQRRVGCPPKLWFLGWRMVSFHILQESLLFCLWLWLLFYRPYCPIPNAPISLCSSVPLQPAQCCTCTALKSNYDGALLILHNTEKYMQLVISRSEQQECSR